MMSLRELAQAIRAAPVSADAQIKGISTDSRTTKPGDLFVALTGPHFDGHDHVEQAVKAGAVAVLVHRNISTGVLALKVDDTRRALGDTANFWRKKFPIPVVAVTGSNGKTTVKEMLARVFARRGDVLATQGNLNNDIGVPLTLLRLRENHRFAVIEMGANRPGEIRYLSALAQPRAAVVTNAAPAHLAGFGSVADVVQAKSEIFTALDDDGIAFVNHDDQHAQTFKRNASPHRTVSFGFTEGANVTADRATIKTIINANGFVTTARVRANLGGVITSFDLKLPLAGEHNVLNALATCAITLSLGFSVQEICDGLAAMTPVPGRLVPRIAVSGVQLIDDSYNANPGSVKAAIDVLMNCAGPRVLALGDMLELGAESAQMHNAIGVYAREKGVDALYATGSYCKEAVIGFGPSAWFFSDSAALGAAMREDILSGRLVAATILVKGSRGIEMENVVRALITQGGDLRPQPHRAMA